MYDHQGCALRPVMTLHLSTRSSASSEETILPPNPWRAHTCYSLRHRHKPRRRATRAAGAYLWTDILSMYPRPRRSILALQNNLSLGNQWRKHFWGQAVSALTALSDSGYGSWWSGWLGLQACIRGSRKCLSRNAQCHMSAIIGESLRRCVPPEKKLWGYIWDGEGRVGRGVVVAELGWEYALCGFHWFQSTRDSCYSFEELGYIG